MISRACAIVLAVVFLSGISIAAAQDMYIQCPAQSIQTDVTTTLPDGWFSTEQGGKLAETYIQNVGGKVRLVCSYKMQDAMVVVMRDAPSGYGCSESSSGFRCTQGGSQAAVPVATAKTIDVEGQARADVPTKEQTGKTLTPGNVKDGTKPSVRTGADCPDLALTGVEVKMLSRDPQGQYFFRLAAGIENQGRIAYAGASGAQYVEIHQVSPGSSPRRVGEVAFTSVPAGDSGVEATYDVLRWRVGQEYPPAYRFSIVYGPDAAADTNPANDDCRMANNSTEIAGDEINSIIQGSAI